MQGRVGKGGKGLRNMKKFNVEMAVGIFMLIGLLCVGYLTIQLGQAQWFKGDSYLVQARFLGVAGLRKGAAVEIAGVTVGQVDRIELDTERMLAVVWMKVEKSVELSEDTIASVRTSGLIGDKYIKLSPGGSDRILEPGQLLTETESAVDIEELVSKYVFGSVH
jgi:phospholipid/cholesterol/gamma-HCH transport system substrate-binding protein